MLKSGGFKSNESGKLHALSKVQRYKILQAIFQFDNENFLPLALKMELLNQEFSTAYSDLDESQKVRCLTRVPSMENKIKFFKLYLGETEGQEEVNSGAEKMTQSKFSQSSEAFYNY
mmetsp:Transcript_7034/g.11829  ORF Transcript_7034/g.11829 Transcript_7034/m.11829 type:complete len:117 (+) Transcript_7034:578-928(+)|eukprot:CAMPEP_0168614714 /NCGR_PEP_ID=MMETSP0449_2-20121227/4126_1 /TAXON_ID=1082188 /ORGANISM="Strombidium rassoulzadegani, Strain ras09" /LENGTH=116 /DNA_ID=CAMNT_0008655421 /DNA_START=522 /DNA_END=872 /DNA_ORIENTATION=+